MNDLSPKRRAAINKEGRTHDRAGIGLAVGLVAFPVWLAGVVWMIPRVSGWPARVADVAWPLAIVAVAYATTRWIGARAQRLAGLDLSMCPSCGYSMTELEPEADGCRVCPECGSAWKVDGDVSAART